jgi:Asp-tRNA(Asn)/Glu-tRNA(Gln) amidotransferase A subunit family amidase
MLLTHLITNKNKGAIILGKTNLSEWANFLFSVVLMAIAQ